MPSPKEIADAKAVLKAIKASKTMKPITVDADIGDGVMHISFVWGNEYGHSTITSKTAAALEVAAAKAASALMVRFAINNKLNVFKVHRIQTAWTNWITDNYFKLKAFSGFQLAVSEEFGSFRNIIGDIMHKEGENDPTLVDYRDVMAKKVVKIIEKYGVDSVKSIDEDIVKRAMNASFLKDEAQQAKQAKVREGLESLKPTPAPKIKIPA